MNIQTIEQKCKDNPAKVWTLAGGKECPSGTTNLVNLGDKWYEICRAITYSRNVPHGPNFSYKATSEEILIAIDCQKKYGRISPQKFEELMKAKLSKE